MLLASFAIGQGSLFVSQSWLVVNGQLALLGIFGTLFTFATLSYYVVDFGGIITLARGTITSDHKEINEQFWNLSAARVPIALFIGLASLIWSQTSDAEFSSAYVVAAIPALLLGAFNPSGIIDGLDRSGLTGLTSILPMLASALALPWVVDLHPSLQGLVMGSAYTFGASISIISQFIILNRMGRRVSVVLPSVSKTIYAARQGAIVLITVIPGHSFSRIQVGISLWLLGEVNTGTFIYAKQIVNGIMQSVQFIRRAQFPRLVRTVRHSGTLGTVFNVQKIAIIAGIASATVLVVFGLAVFKWVGGELGEAGLLIASFGPVVIASSVYAALWQALVADDRTSTAAGVGNCALLVGSALTVLLVPFFNYYAFAFAETLMNIVGLIAILAIWDRKRGLGPKAVRHGN